MGAKKKKQKEPNDKFMQMSEEELIEFINKTTDQIKESKNKRNFVQQERDLITNFYDISKDEENKLKEAIEKEEVVMDTLQKEHQDEINAFINKYRHLEYDHEMFMTSTLTKISKEANDTEEQIRANRETIYMKKKEDLKSGIKTNTITHKDQITKEKDTLARNFDDKKKSLEDRLRRIIKNYKNKMEELRLNLELRLKVEIHELEERKNLHINNLNRTFDEKMSDWKTENIKQIKESINIIKENLSTLKDLENENRKLRKDNDILAKEIAALQAKYDEALNINKAVTNRLKKYHNQAINMKNMKAKIISLRSKCSETMQKTKDIEEQKKDTQDKIDDLKNNFRYVLEQYKTKTEHKNQMLEHHLKSLNDNYEKKEIEIEDILKNVDIVGNRNLGDEQQGNNGFNRDMFNELMEHIKSTLSDKTIIIKRLKSSLALAAKAFNDTIRVYETKLIEFGLPPEELGFQLLETNTSKMPAGLVSD